MGRELYSSLSGSIGDYRWIVLAALRWKRYELSGGRGKEIQAKLPKELLIGWSSKEGLAASSRAQSVYEVDLPRSYCKLQSIRVMDLKQD